MTSSPLVQAWTVFLAQQKTPFVLHDAIRALSLKKPKRNQLHRLIKQGLGQGILLKANHGSYLVAAHQPKYQGTIDKIHSKLAFIHSPQLPRDVRVLREEVPCVMHKDSVDFLLTQESSSGNKGSFSRAHTSSGVGAKIVRIRHRGTHTLVGTTTYQGKALYVIPNGRKHPPIRVIGKLGPAAHKAQVRITQYPTPSNAFNIPQEPQELQGEITQLLGPAGAHEAEIQSIIAAWELPTTFDKKLTANHTRSSSKQGANIDAQELHDRQNLRDRQAFTIDPEDAQDFDDALSIRKLSQDRWEVGIHIADVSHYVQLNSDIDKEAQRRATSVYLVDRCLPMLPEYLSNDLCSLRPHQDRLTYSLLLTLDNTGRVHKQWVGKAVIHSQQRLDYDQAWEILQDPKAGWHDTLAPLNVIAQQLRRQRFAHGGIEVHAPEFAFRLDDTGYPIAVRLKKWHAAHVLIEEFMLLANRQVATLGQQLAQKKDCDFVYRVHATPSPPAFDNLMEHASYLGYKLPCSKKHTPQGQIDYIQRLIKKAQGRPEENIVQMLVIRSLAKARYTTQIHATPATGTSQASIQHFGLGFERYTHFTSPIRRYPDLMVHRLLHALLTHQPLPKQNHQALCEHSTAMEIRATEAERASIKYKQAEYMDRHIGQVFESMITGGNNWKLFVVLLETGIDGAIPIGTLKGDYYKWHEKKLYMRGTHHGKILRVGDYIQVRVTEVDLMQHIVLVEAVA